MKRSKGDRALILAIALAVVMAVVAMVILREPPAGSPGWTGAAITVPACPEDAAGCRISVVKWSDAEGGGDASVTAQEHWSGAATTLQVLLPAGAYAVSAEGCRGYKIENTRMLIAPGYHRAIGLSTIWDLLGFVGRGCPGFNTVS